MPYTPPAQQSPGASKPQSPTLSRSHSHSHGHQSSSPGFSKNPRPGLPRSVSSASYLHKHRRSPSLTKSCESPTSPPDKSPLQQVDVTNNVSEDEISPKSIRQSPPPVNNNPIPPGAVATPPESTQNSSDDEDSGARGRAQELTALAELQAAIRVIEQHRESSPTDVSEGLRKAKMTLGLYVPDSNFNVQTNGETHPSPLSSDARRVSHSRSATESQTFQGFSLGNDDSTPTSQSTSDSDEEVDRARPKKPPMLRKKSGELVRPALRPASAKRRPSSMPGTPTYGKAVHFDSHLEHVRHFLQVDRPLAVSAGSSPAEPYESDNEFPFGGESQSLTPPFKWEIRLANFPHQSVQRLAQPVKVEEVFLSKDKKHLIGSIAVANLAFHKSVVARFTLDYWKTTSEVVASYSKDIRRRNTNDGLDRFSFDIKLADQANLEKKTLFFCVRYNVNGQEFWDSNENMNYQVDFIKNALPQNGKRGMQPASARPLAQSRPSTSAASARPISMPSSFDDFANAFDSNFAFRSGPKIRGEEQVRLKKPGGSSWSHNPNGAKPPAQAFGNRYDFGASLSAAIQAASTTLGDRDRDEQLPLRSQPVNSTQKTNAAAPSTLTNGNAGTTKTVAPLTDTTKPKALTSEKPAIQSHSYNELLDKYCFVRSQPPLSPKDVLREANEMSTVWI